MAFNHIQYMREYNSRPEVIERHKQYNKEYIKRPGSQEIQRKSSLKYSRRPEIKERLKEYRQRPENRAARAERARMPKNRRRRSIIRAQDKLKCLRHYGGNIPKCARCKLVDVRFLVLDHIAGVGKENRHKYHWHITHNYPADMQVLCYACNHNKERQPLDMAESRYSRIIFRRAKDAIVKLKVLRHYGGPIPRCAWCRIVDTRFLVLDHIDGGGRNERETTGRTGAAYFGWLVKHNYPRRLQVLCYYCNLKKH